MNSDPDRQPPFLSYGFRPFFLLASLYAAFAILAWTGWLLAHDLPGVLIVPPFSAAPHLWHGHEMVFGYSAAVLAGFMLTAVPSWTGARRIAGPPLAFLAALWLAGRVAVWFSASLPGFAVAVIDIAFLPVLGAMVAAGLMVRPAPRNLVFLVFLLLLAVANGVIHAEWMGLVEDMASRALSAAIMLLALMVAIIGGRIVPAFTRNVLIMRGGTALPRSFARVDQLAIGSLAVLVALTALGIEGPASAFAAFIAAAAHGVRLGFWRGLATLNSPILWSLHLAYGFLVLALAALGLAHLGTGLGVTSAMHLLSVGAIGGMTLAVMSRVALGHTGRILSVARPIALAYVLLAASALVRGLGVEFLPDHYIAMLVTAGTLWIAAFAVFAVLYVPILTGPPVPKPSGRSPSAA